MKLLYEYPEVVSKAKQISAAKEREQDMKKIKKMLFNSTVLCAVLLLVCVLCEFVWLKIALCVFAVLIFSASLVFAASLKAATDPDVYVKIYDDHIESYQPSAFGAKKHSVNLNYSDIAESRQTVTGSMSFLLKDGTSKSIYFVNTAAKLFLINELHESIKYPKKNYIEYKNTESDEWEVKTDN